MKKHILFMVCCIVFAVSGMAQPKTDFKSEKYARKSNFVEINKEFYLKKEKPDYAQKPNSLHQLSYTPKQSKSADWWEPDTIFVSFTDGELQRNIYSYSNGKCTFYVVQVWYNNQWANYQKVTYTYDAQNNVTEELWQYFTSQWENEHKYTYVYDAQNNNTEGFYSEWEEKWIPVDKYSNTFNANNLVEESIYLYWNNKDNKWENDMKENYTYNSSHNEEVMQVSYWENGAWILFWRQTYDYDSQNNLIEIFYEYCEDDIWENLGLQTFYYDTQNRVSYYIFQEWEYGIWINVIKILLTYDNQDNITSEIWQLHYTGDWKNMDKSSVTYDENNNAINGHYQYWEGNQWVEDNGHLMVYYNHMQSVIYLGGNKFTATYNTQEVSIKENDIVNNSVKIYPNPVSDMLYIEIDNLKVSELKIYSIQGGMLMNVQGNKIDVSSLQKGIYIVDVNGIRKKIVKM